MWTNIRFFNDEKEHVRKFIFEKENDIAVEAVLYKYPTYKERTVLCISVMCGCPVGCRFCGTGDYFIRSLTVEEIVDQAVHILSNEIEGLDPIEIDKLQIMFMSMGDGLLVKALPEALRRLYKLYPNAALLISTSGPDVSYQEIISLAQEIPTIGLQFSVHESTNEKRNELIPFKKKLTLEDIAAVGRSFYSRTKRKPFFNYCAHENNSSYDDAIRLANLFDPIIWEATVSVICERDDFCARNDFQRELAVNFSSKLLEQGFNVRVFDPAGQDTISGGCGQLAYYQKWVKEHPELAKPSIGHGLQKIHAPMLNKEEK
jgi:23S rRNA (adenine2503-C2)-methyltransferase